MLSKVMITPALTMDVVKEKVVKEVMVEKQEANLKKQTNKPPPLEKKENLKEKNQEGALILILQTTAQTIIEQNMKTIKDLLPLI